MMLLRSKMLRPYQNNSSRIFSKASQMQMTATLSLPAAESREASDNVLQRWVTQIHKSNRVKTHHHTAANETEREREREQRTRLCKH